MLCDFRTAARTKDCLFNPIQVSGVCLGTGDVGKRKQLCD